MPVPERVNGLALGHAPTSYRNPRVDPRDANESLVHEVTGIEQCPRDSLSGDGSDALGEIAFLALGDGVGVLGCQRVDRGPSAGREVAADGVDHPNPLRATAMPRRVVDPATARRWTDRDLARRDFTPAGDVGAGAVAVVHLLHRLNLGDGAMTEDEVALVAPKTEGVRPALFAVVVVVG